MNHKIIIAKHSGYCMGVKRAFFNSFRVSREYQNICIYGEMVHNKFALQSLYDKGIMLKKSLDEIIEDEKIKNVLIRAHGIPPAVERILAENNKIVFDFTCPKVKRVQLLVKKLSSENRSIILFGKRSHPEVIGIIGYCSSPYYIIKDIDEAKRLSFEDIKNPVFLSQTTMNSDNFFETCNFLNNKFGSLIIFNTLCNAPVKIQTAAIELAKRMDMMIVVGDKLSANTTTLFEKIQKIKPALFIESEKEIRVDQIKNYRIIGITGGSSTPVLQMENVKKFLEKNLP